MRTALDINGNRIYATDSVRYEECFCIACGEKLKHKKGKIYQPYFAHMPDTTCSYGKDKDNKSEWHIRMQNYFPNDLQEVRFVDEETGEVHIADVYMDKSNTVLEFQHSQIDPEEFDKRTNFHLKNGRRVVWLFDESVENQNLDNYGRFKASKTNYENNELYKDKVFKWLRSPRSFIHSYMIQNNLSLDSDVFSICVYTGTEGDVFHKLINHYIGFDNVTFSVHDIAMSSNLNIDEFFKSEGEWLQEEPFISELKEIERKSHLPKEIADRDVLSIFELWKSYEYQMIAYNTEEHKCYLIRESKYNKGKMMTNSNNTILYQYVDWNFIQMKIRNIYNKFYPLSNSKAFKKIWILVRGYGKNGIWR